MSDANPLDQLERWMLRRRRAEKVASYFAADLFRTGTGCLGFWLVLKIFTDDPATNTVALMLLTVGLLQILAHGLAMMCSVIKATDRFALDRNSHL